MDGMMYKGLEKQEVLNAKRMCEKGQPVQVEPTASKVMRMLEDLTQISSEVRSLALSKLDPIIFPSQPIPESQCNIDRAAPQIWPPLFGEMRVHIETITLNLISIKETINKVEV